MLLPDIIIISGLAVEVVIFSGSVARGESQACAPGMSA